MCRVPYGSTYSRTRTVLVRGRSAEISGPTEYSVQDRHIHLESYNFSSSSVFAEELIEDIVTAAPADRPRTRMISLPKKSIDFPRFSLPKGMLHDGGLLRSLRT